MSQQSKLAAALQKRGRFRIAELLGTPQDDRDSAWARSTVTASIACLSNTDDLTGLASKVLAAYESKWSKRSAAALKPKSGSPRALLKLATGIRLRNTIPVGFLPYSLDNTAAPQGGETKTTDAAGLIVDNPNISTQLKMMLTLSSAITEANATRDQYFAWMQRVSESITPVTTSIADLEQTFVGTPSAPGFLPSHNLVHEGATVLRSMITEFIPGDTKPNHTFECFKVISGVMNEGQAFTERDASTISEWINNLHNGDVFAAITGMARDVEHLSSGPSESLKRRIWMLRNDMQLSGYAPFVPLDPTSDTRLDRTGDIPPVPPAQPNRTLADRPTPAWLPKFEDLQHPDDLGIRTSRKPFVRTASAPPKKGGWIVSFKRQPNGTYKPDNYYRIKTVDGPTIDVEQRRLRGSAFGSSVDHCLMTRDLLVDYGKAVEEGSHFLLVSIGEKTFVGAPNSKYSHLTSKAVGLAKHLGVPTDVSMVKRPEPQLER